MLKRFSTKRIFLPLFVIAAIAILGTVIVVAQEKSEGKVELNVKVRGAEAEISPEAQAVQDISLALQLAEYGRRVKSAEALAVAAQILLDNPTQEMEAEKKEEPSKGAPVKEQAKKDTPQPVVEPAKLLEEAKSMAAGNQTVLALIEQLQSRVTGNR